MSDQRDDPLSRLQDYEKRIEEWMESAREEIERQAPEVLDKLASTVKGIAQRLDDLANDARQRRAEKDATPESAGPPDQTRETAATDKGTSGPPDASAAPSDGSDTATP